MSRVLSSLIFIWISVLKEIPIQGRPLSITPKQQHPQGHPKGWSLGEEHVAAAWMGWDGMGMPSGLASLHQCIPACPKVRGTPWHLHVTNNFRHASPPSCCLSCPLDLPRLNAELENVTFSKSSRKLQEAFQIFQGNIPATNPLSPLITKTPQNVKFDLFLLLGGILY